MKIDSEKTLKIKWYTLNEHNADMWTIPLNAIRKVIINTKSKAVVSSRQEIKLADNDQGGEYEQLKYNWLCSII